MMDASWIDYRESLVRHAHKIVKTSQQPSAFHDEQPPTVSMSKALFFVDIGQNDKTRHDDYACAVTLRLELLSKLSSSSSLGKAAGNRVHDI